MKQAKVRRDNFPKETQQQQKVTGKYSLMHRLRTNNSHRVSTTQASVAKVKRLTISSVDKDWSKLSSIANKSVK